MPHDLGFSADRPSTRPCQGRSPGTGSAGLVLPETSDTRFRVDPQRGRLRRMKAGVITAARLAQERVQNSKGRRWRCAMITLTYRDQSEFSARQITNLLKAIRQWGLRRGFTVPYVWVLERGSHRGRIHYHVLCWLPPGVSMPKPDKQGWWPHGMTKIEWARRPVGYMAKYASKGDNGRAFPPGARIHGAGGLTAEERAERCWWTAPAWVREHWPDWTERPRPAPGGGWASRVTGEWRPSPWTVVGFDSGGVIVEKRFP